MDDSWKIPISLKVVAVLFMLVGVQALIEVFVGVRPREHFSELWCVGPVYRAGIACASARVENVRVGVHLAGG